MINGNANINQDKITCLDELSDEDVGIYKRDRNKSSIAKVLIFLFIALVMTGAILLT